LSLCLLLPAAAWAQGGGAAGEGVVDAGSTIPGAELDGGAGEAAMLEQPAWSGSLNPGKGFQVAQGRYGSLNIGAYVLVRYLNQLPGTQTYVDHLGNERPIDTRNDISAPHRVLLPVSGFIYNPKFVYLVQFWTVLAIDKVAIIGYLGYRFGPAFNLYAGVGALPGTATLKYSHPYWLGTDRVMADEYFRPGFTQGVWASGEPIPGLFYTAMVGNNISTLNINAAEDTRDFALSGSVWWEPTTHEFGPNNALGDYEGHDRVATMIGASYTRSRENRFTADASKADPDNTQIRMGDSLLLFKTGALASGVTVQDALYQLFSAVVGAKYRGFFVQAEYYRRWLNGFVADGPLPFSQDVDQGFYVQASAMVLPRRLELYGATSWIFPDPAAGYRDSYDFLGGLNVYPFDTRNNRFNAQVIRVVRSPASSLFGYYVGGQSGTTLSVAWSTYF
jgi:hypothetical protein